MDITHIRSHLSKEDKLMLIPVFSDEEFIKTVPTELKTLIGKRQKDFSAKTGESLLLFSNEQDLPGKILLIGFGSKKHLNANSTRELAALAIKSAKTQRIHEISFYLPETLVKYAWSLSEGFGLGNYSPAKYMTGKNKEQQEKQDVKKITIVRTKQGGNLGRDVIEGMEVANAVNEVRDLVNAPPSLKNVDALAAHAKSIAKQNGYSLKIFTKKELQKMGMGGILAVNAGSATEAKMVVLEYEPRGRNKKEEPTVIVGKGVIFDSGGYNLKPSSSLNEMQLDMAGAAAVMGVFRLLKRLDIKQHVVGIFPLTDNAIGSNAQKPSEVITTYNGTTVEITNTDAEGRLILCDALSYAFKKYQPRYMIDIATLTGACMVALGDRYAGLFGNDKNLIEKLRRAGEAVDELCWPMPIHPDHRTKMKSKIADLRNWDEVPYAGASKGAAFLEYFVGETAWAHLDIAGPSFVKDPKKYESPMGTGFGVRLLLEFLRG